ncbi:hypothetical protein GCM10009000_119030 [Halobacterium noricense]
MGAVGWELWAGSVVEKTSNTCNRVGPTAQKDCGRNPHTERVPWGIETLTDGTRNSGDMSDSVDADEVEHVADLARVDLDDEERAQFADQFGDILEHFEALDEVPEVEAEPDLVNVMRSDEVEQSLSQEEALRNADDSEDGRFKGPKVS